MSAVLQSHQLDPAMLWSLLEACTDGAFYWDRASDTVLWSEKTYRTLGYEEPAQRRYEDVRELVHPDERDAHDDAVHASVDEGVYRHHTRLKAADGSYRSFQVNGVWRPADRNRPETLFGYLVDVTDSERRIERETRGERLLRAFFDNCPAAAFLKGAENRHVYGNARAAEFAGVDLDAFLRTNADALFDADTAAQLAEVDRQVREQRELVVWSGPITTKTGRSMHIFDTKFPVEDPDSGEIMVGGFGVDITREHELERALAQAQKMDALGQLVAGVAHDFNNTLAVLRGNLDLLRERHGGSEESELLDDMLDAARRAERLTRELLAHGRRAPLRPEPVDIGALIARPERIFRSAVPETIQVFVNAPSGLPAALADPAGVETAVLNLALNARDAMPQGGRLELSADAVLVPDGAGGDAPAALAPGRYVRLSVADSGVGMAPEVMERAFEPFFTTKPAGRGSGMGLAMVFGFMHQLGGAVSMDSRPGEGVRVDLYFPAVATGAGAQDEPEPRPAKIGKRVLLVEDEEAVRRTMRRQLEALGCTVTEAADGAAALDALEAGGAVDLVLSDVVMPGDLQGLELADRIVARHPAVEVVLMSGYPLAASVGERDVGAFDVRAKPLSLADLAALAAPR